MKKNIKQLVLFVIILIAIIFIQNKVEAKSYYIKNMDIQANININGSVDIEQTLTYNFNGEYNGIYITVPYKVTDNEYKDIIKNNRINDNLYTGSEVNVESVSEITEKTENSYSLATKATNGDNGVYTTTKESKLFKIKVYSPSSNELKTFKIKYNIKDLCVKHNDIGELYYNFIGGEWECSIKNLNIDIYIPYNKSEIKVWGHGPYNGQSKIISNTHANFKVNDIEKGQYVAARVLFDNSNIANSTKNSGISAMETIYENENDIIEHKEEKRKFTKNVVIMGICLLIYWIILLLSYEKDKKYILENIDEDYLFNKYNPMIAGCIQGSRDILSRDIIAVILNLIEKGNIKLEIKDKFSEGKLYPILKVPEKEKEMDDIEKYIYDWVFKGKTIIELSYRLEEMPKEKDASEKFKELNTIVEEKLAQMGANKKSVPMVIRAFNIFLFVLSVLVVIRHIIYNGINKISIPSSLSLYIIILLVMAGVASILLNIIIMVRHQINKIVQRITGQRVVTTTVSLVVLFGVIIIITAIISPGSYLIADEFLICTATILILTDNLMLKNNVNMIEDYSKLNTLKHKLENSLLSDKDIEHVTLWEKYLAYAVSFGISKKIIKKIKGLNLDDDLTKLINNNDISEYLATDYYSFYTYASLDRRFLRSYNETVGKAMSSIGSNSDFFGSSGGGYSSGDGGGFSGGGGYSGGGGNRWRWRSLLRRKYEFTNNLWKIR